MRILLIVVGLALLFIALVKVFFHSTCLGNEGIPWWPNSGCTCKGILVGNMSVYSNVGGGAKYCIGILEEKFAGNTSQVQPTPTHQSQDETANWKTYTNNNRGFSLKYPSDWRYEELITRGGATFKSKEGKDTVSAQFFYKTNPLIVDLKEYVQKGAIKEYPNFQELKTIQEITTDSKIIGYKVTWQYIQTGQQTLLVTLPITYFSAINNDSTIKIALVDEQYANVYAGMLKSFNVDKGLIVIPKVPCVKEGETGNYFDGQQCCSGLKDILPSPKNNDKSKCQPAISNGGFQCTKCGDELCGPGENICNCSQDCK